MPAAHPAPDADERDCDVLVVGGGVAGLSAGIAAAEAGASVVLLDERHAPGGQFAKALMPSHADSAPDRQFRLGMELRARAERAGVRLESDASVWGAFAPDEIAALVRGQSVMYRPRRLILATGAHERPVPVPGWTLPGVMTTGGLQTLVRAQRVTPGQRVLIAGNGPLNLQLACELVAGGVHPVAVLEAAPRARYGRLAGSGADGPVATGAGARRMGDAAHAETGRRSGAVGHRLDRLAGDGRVQEAVAGDHRFDVDVVALNMGFQPEAGLARALGVPHRFVGYLATEADAEGRTAVDGVFAVGDGAVFGGAPVAQARGRLAGLAAARDLRFAAPADPKASRRWRRRRHSRRRCGGSSLLRRYRLPMQQWFVVARKSPLPGCEPRSPPG